MEKYYQTNDINVFGFEVKTFPEGISSAFDKLYKELQPNQDRTYYGISYLEKGQIKYYVAAAEIADGEAKTYGGQSFFLAKGEYLIEPIMGWYEKLDSIKDAFDALMKDSRIDRTQPCVEWYKSDDEMYCMIKLK